MKSGILPLVNAFGCLLLAGLVAVQWSRERTSDATVKSLESELRTAAGQKTADAERITALERDIVALKESIEATQKAADGSAQALAAAKTQNQTQMQTIQSEAANAANAQVKIWQDAIDQRDTKLRSLNADLIATRARLNEAIGKLKEAGAH